MSADEVSRSMREIDAATVRVSYLGRYAMNHADAAITAQAARIVAMLGELGRRVETAREEIGSLIARP